MIASSASSPAGVHPLACHHISTGLRADLTWWHDILNSWCGRCILPTSDWEDLRFFTDASGGLGAGGLLGDRWWCLRWSAAYREVSNDGAHILEGNVCDLGFTRTFGPALYRSPHHSLLRQLVLRCFSRFRPCRTTPSRDTTVLNRVPFHLRARLHSVLSQRTLVTFAQAHHPSSPSSPPFTPCPPRPFP